jgi:hypothetical protein
MRLEPVCELDLHYTSDFHLARDGEEVGRQGVISAVTRTMHLDVFQCVSEI